MKTNSFVRIHKLAFVLLLLCAFSALVCAANPPQVTKVEPPNWWIGLPPSELMVMLTGHDLDGASISVSYSGVRLTHSQAQPGGHYAFVWLDIAASARSGDVPIAVRTSAGTTTVKLPLRARESTAGKFQGISKNDVIYLIMPDRFADGDTTNDEPAPNLKTYDRAQPKAWHGGDLKGVRDHLSYLRDLGVTAIWMTPFWANDWRADDHSYHGYHATDFYAVDQHMGSLQDLHGLVSDAHRLGMKVIIDYVVNHTGPGHPWSTQPPTATWLHGTPQNHLSPAYDFGSLVDPHAVAAQQRHTLEGWFAEKLPDLNPDDPLLAQYLAENAEWWLEQTGIDAFRLDTFPYSSRKFWSGWHHSIFTAYPQTNSIGEVWANDSTITSFFAGGRKQWDGIDSGVSTVFDYPFFFALRDVTLRGASPTKLMEVLQHDALYPNPGMLVTFLGNHDTRRFMGEQGATKQKLEAAFSLLLTFRGIPEIYAGDEIDMSGGDDPDNRRDFPGGFPGDQRNAFTRAGRTADEQDVFTRVQNLLQLRKEHASLRTGKLYHMGVGDHWYAFTRIDGNDRVLVVYSNAGTPQQISISLADTPLENVRDASSLLNAPPARVGNKTIETEIAPDSVAIYELK